MNKVVALAVITLTLIHVSTAATVLYVDGTVSATGNGTLASPYKTIVEAFTVATSGSTIQVATATYAEAITWNVAVTLVAPNGATLTLPTSGLRSITATISGNIGTLQGFTITNGQNGAIAIQGNLMLTIQNCTFIGNSNSNQKAGGAINSIRFNTTIVINNCRFDNNSYGAIQLYQGASASLQITNSVFRNNLFVDTFNIPGGAIRMDSGSLYVDSSTFIANEMAIYIQNSNNVTISNSNFYDNTEPGTVDASFTIKCNTVPSYFVNTGNNFCGYRGNLISCGSWTPSLTWHDGCGVCQGNNSNRDCAGSCFGTATTCPARKTIYVSPTGAGNQTGVNPLNAMNGIQAGINNAVNYDTIIAAEGTYTVTSFLKFGGKVITLKSIYGQPERTFIQCSGNIPGLSVTSGESFDTVIQGFTFTNCQPGIVASASSPSIKSCNFVSNAVSSLGGGIRSTNSFVRVDDCAFIGNSAPHGGGMSVGVQTDYYTQAVISNSRFANNTASIGGASLYVDISASLILSNSYFINSVAGEGNSLYLDNSASYAIYNCSFNSEAGASNVYAETGAVGTGTLLTYCGATGSTIHGPGSWPAVVTAATDSCSVCGGNNKNLDCNGTCFGRQIRDKANGCCLYFEEDCNGICHGESVVDDFSTCCVVPLVIDCTGRCNGTYRRDKVATCCDGPLIDRTNTCCSGVIDCAGYCNGSSIYDNSTTTKQCCLPNQLDQCGICNGTDACVGCASECQHNGTCFVPTKTCNCTGGYRGTDCTTYDCNARQNCNGGTCIGPNICNCTGASGTGPACSDVTCGNFTCQNNGTCIPSNSTCDCRSSPAGYFGPNCGNFTCTLTCQHNGVCIGPNKCDCTNSGGYFGDQCDNFTCGACAGGKECVAPNLCQCLSGNCTDVTSGTTDSSNQTSKGNSSSSLPIPLWAIIVVAIGALIIILLIIILIVVCCKRRGGYY